MLKRKMNKISNKIYSIEYYDSIVAINIKSSNLKYSKNIQNNNRLNRYFTDYRFKRVINKKYQRGNSLINFIKSNKDTKKFNNIITNALDTEMYYLDAENELNDEDVAPSLLDLVKYSKFYRLKGVISPEWSGID